MSAEQIETCSKKSRGMARRSLDLIEAMDAEAEAARPITGRGIGYKLFTAGLIPSMAKKETAAASYSLRSGSASTTPSFSAAITAFPWSCSPGACGSHCSKR
jgi:hypothetical protein